MYGDRYIPMSFYDSLADARKSLKERSLLSLEWQISLLDWLRTTTSHQAYSQFMGAYGYRHVDDDGGRRDLMGQWLHDQVAQVVETSPTYYVSGDMCEMVRMGAEAIEIGMGLQETDLPTDKGFLVFDRPMKVYGPAGVKETGDLTQGEDVMISAIAWEQGSIGQVDEHITGEERYSPGSATVTAQGVKYWLFMTPHDAAVVYNLGMERAGRSRERILESDMRQERGPLNLYDFSGWTFGQAWVEIPYGQEQEPGWNGESFKAHPIVNQVRRMLLATWRLLGQKIVHTEINFAPRQLRRRAQRFMPCDGDILIIRLRREFSPRAQLEELGESGEVWWTHRWTVRGHWRRPKGSGLDAEKTEWVSPYIKGPAHLPLITKDKIFSLEN